MLFYPQIPLSPMKALGKGYDFSSSQNIITAQNHCVNYRREGFFIGFLKKNFDLGRFFLYKGASIFVYSLSSIT